MLVLKRLRRLGIRGFRTFAFDYYQLKQLDIPKKLLAIQNLECFDFVLWRELLTTLDQQLQRPALGLEIAQLVEVKHLGIIGYLTLSSETLEEAFMRYHDYHRLIYDGIHSSCSGKVIMCRLAGPKSL